LTSIDSHHLSEHVVLAAPVLGAAHERFASEQTDQLSRTRGLPSKQETCDAQPHVLRTLNAHGRPRKPR
jgi:hypothetical protein